MNKRDTVSRRQFLGFGFSVLTAAPLAASLMSACSGPTENGVPRVKVEEADPIAKAVGFKVDATTVDTSRFPKRAGENGANQFCYNCSLFRGSPTDEFAACTMFPGKAVPKNGWCNAWVPKAAT